MEETGIRGKKNERARDRKKMKAVALISKH
jgi:hypothetical protein